MAEQLAKKVKAKSRSKGRGASVFALSGELGGGKTTFVQGFLRGLGIKRRAASPTFILMRRFGNLHHLDAYRLKKPSELARLGFPEILRNPRNIVLVEWADRVRKLIPRNAIWIKFKHGKKENERIIAY